MSGVSWLDRIAGHPVVRSQVNRAFRLHAARRTAALATADPVRLQRSGLLRLLKVAAATRFGRDHSFAALRSVRDFQNAVPLRTYEALWNDYLKDAYPVFQDLTWPGLIPYLSLTSGTTQGNTKYIPVSRAMIRSNEKAARTMVAYHVRARPDSRLFQGRMFFLGGSSDLERPAPGVQQGDLSGIAAKELSPILRPYTFPPLDLALISDWDLKLTRLARASVQEPITLVSGVPSWLLVLFQRVLEITGQTTISDVWPSLELIVHGGVKFDPYEASFRDVVGSPTVRLQESYPCSEGFIAFGDPETGLLRLCFDHGLFYEFVPLDELGRDRPTRHWLGDVVPGVNYAIVVSTRAGLWAHLIGDTVRFESLNPPLLRFTGRTKYSLSAFGEHLVSEEVEAAVASACSATGATVRDWHVGPVFQGALGHHLFVFEFLKLPADLGAFREALDRELCHRNADYQAHRAEGVGLPLPEVVVCRSGGIESWMRSRGKLGGQHKFPRMDASGALTRRIVEELREAGFVGDVLAAG
ncbi:MAG: GH3 auxin-responsive promoter family protein [Isosphaeraceae bacterium]